MGKGHGCYNLGLLALSELYMASASSAALFARVHLYLVVDHVIQ